jgi:hypothetical protein
VEKLETYKHSGTDLISAELIRVSSRPPHSETHILTAPTYQNVFFYVVIQGNKREYSDLELRGLSPQERTIPTERPLLVGEVSAHFSG